MSVAVFRPSTVLPGLGSCAYCSKSIYCAHPTHNCRPICTAHFSWPSLAHLARHGCHAHAQHQTVWCADASLHCSSHGSHNPYAWIGCPCNNRAFTVITDITVGDICYLATADNCGANHYAVHSVRAIGQRIRKI